MKTTLVDAVDTFVIEGEGIFQPMLKLSEQYPNQKIILTNATALRAVKSAQSLGITSYHYDSAKKDLGALKKFLDLNL